MRRIPIAALLALCLVATAAGAARAKETTVTLSDPPGGGIPSGQTWRADLDVVADPPEMLNEITLAPVVTVLNVDTGASQSFKATPTDDPGKFTADIKAVGEGHVYLSVVDGHSDRAHEFGPYTITTSSGDTAGTAGGAWYSNWPRTGLGGAALAALAAAALLLIRRSRREDAAGGALAS